MKKPLTIPEKSAELTIPRDRWNRPLIQPEGGGKAIPYRRVTTFIDVLDDKSNLAKWQQRNVAYGMSLDSTLVERMKALGVMPTKADPEAEKEWKREAQLVVNDADKEARSTRSADLGTALHGLTERMDLGQSVGFVPPNLQKHLDNYAAATEGIQMEHVEKFVVQDDLQVGGTPDRVGWVDGQLTIIDTKTGNIEYGAGKIAMQLAIYAHSKFYNPATFERTSLGPVRQDKGLIVELNAWTGECELHWIDLELAWITATSITPKVHEWRKHKAKKFLSPYGVSQGVPS